MSDHGKVGLVLSGGGAKGAYQIGVLKALVELNIPVDVISGASIGSLNGAVIASAPTLSEGVQRLETIWSELAKDSPVKIKKKLPYFQLLLAAGLRPNIAVASVKSLMTLLQSKGVRLPDFIHDFAHQPMMDDAPLKGLLNRYLDNEALSNGIPMYVSVFKSAGGFDLFRVAAAELGLMETADSECKHLQSIPAEKERKEFLLASAAIPLAFAPRQVDGTLYSDGGQGGWRKVQGNTPILPLIEESCDLIIVNHLSDGSLWSKTDFPDNTIVEIRPQKAIARDGGLKDLLGFDETKMHSWMTQGYDDTLQCLNDIISVAKGRHELKQSEETLAASMRGNAPADAKLAQAMSRLSEVQ